MSHTPAPWEINRYSNYEGYSISADKRGCIAERWYPVELDEKEDAEMAANARLIAAAPEMLDLLRQARRRWLDAARAQEYWTPQEKDDLRRIDSSIAKAEGGDL